MAATLDEGARALDKLAVLLRGTDKLTRDYAFAVRKRAGELGRGRPTPQARGVAETLRVRGRGSILGTPGSTAILSGRPVRAGGVNFGAEYGSSRVPQFGPRNEGGYFLNPAADQVDDAPGERWLDDALDDALRGLA